MPRRRGSANSSAGRRAQATDEARCNGGGAKRAPTTSATPTKSAKRVPTARETSSGSSPTNAPPAPPAVNDRLQDGSLAAADPSSRPETAAAASVTGDLGYLHKKFKKVAAAFSADSSHRPAVNDVGQWSSVAPASAPSAEPGDGAKQDGAAQQPTPVPATGVAARSGGGRYVCPYCQHACAKPSVLEKHIRAHTNERPYPCVPCGFAFKTKSNLYKHCKSRTHVLKVEEGGQSALAMTSDPAEAGSDDTSENDENAPVDDSDDGEPMAAHHDPADRDPHPHPLTPPLPPAPQLDPPPPPPPPPPSSSSSSASTPDKFKTPYKPKFHNLKACDEGTANEAPPAPPASGTPPADGSLAALRPSAGFLQERISQIISQNQAIVETMDPIWPRRYVRQSSRDKDSVGGAGKQPAPQRVAEPKKNPGRERSCSLTVEGHDPGAGPLKPSPAVHQAIKFIQDDETQRKRSYSEGPGDGQLRHSVRNLLHPQNPEGSIIKDILLKSRGILPAESEDVPAATTCSFSVSALLNPSRSKAASPPNEPAAAVHDDEDQEKQPKKARVSPTCDNGAENGSRFTKSRPVLPLFGQVDIRDGQSGSVQSDSPSCARAEASQPSKPVPHVPGIPGPYSSGNVVVYQPAAAAAATALPVVAGCEEEPAAKFLRPSSLCLEPGTFSVKKANMTGVDLSSGEPSMLCVSGAGMTLVSPETPRPRKLIRQLYLNGHAYTYLGLKCSTRVYFCCLSKAQPMYVPHQAKLSMYSQWKTRPPPGTDSAAEAMTLYDSRQRPPATTTAHSAESHRMILTHSSYWTNRDRPASAHVKIEELDDRSASKAAGSLDDAAAQRADRAKTPVAVSSATQAVAQQPKRVRIFAGGFKSTEEYTYVRGRGRGRYVCEECGIRCKKPSMLKKHIRTHTDLRPYTCRQCNFSFKTKGNLTKHMKSKAHHKKCTELGIVPVPTSVDDANIDEESLARQESMKHLAGSGSGNEADSDVDDEDEDDNDNDNDNEEDDELDEDDDELDEEMADDDANNAQVNSSVGQFEDAEPRLKELGEREQEVARSLLDLGVMAPAGLAKPTTYPYASRAPDESAEAVDIKEEAPPAAPVSPAKNQAVDLSNRCPSPAAAQPPPSAMLVSIYNAKVVNERVSPEAEPAASGMLQAYLTEKAMKEGQMKRHQAKLPSLVPAEQQVKSRPEFAGPVTGASTAAAIASSAIAAAAMSGGVQTAQSTAPVTYRLTDDGKTACSICNKVFTKPSQLRLHINIHYFERPFRCEACAVSFRTKGHLQKHKRSVTHFNKVNMNLTFGTPSTENPRPFKCSDCMIAFRIHGHLAKHLRSKMHIMKLECLGKLPFGTYAEMERSGVNLNEIDTTDCHNSLESLQSLAHRLYKQDPAKIQQWQQEVAAQSRERSVSCSSEEFSDVADDGDELDEDGDDSDGLPDEALRHQRKVDSIEPPNAQMPPPKVSPLPPPPPPEAPKPAPSPSTVYCSACGESFTSAESFQAHVMDKHRPPSSNSVYSRPDVRSPSPLAPIKSNASGSEFNRAPQHGHEPRRESPTRASAEASRGVQWSLAPEMAYAQAPMYYPHPNSLPSHHVWPGRPPPKFTDFVALNQMAAVSPHWHQEAWMASRHLMMPLTIGAPLPAPNFPVPAAPLPAGYNGTLRTGRHLSPVPPSNVAGPSDDASITPCEICGKSFANKDQLRQHVISHAQLRPFVCEFCDAGFTTQKHLEAHLVLHRPRTS